VNLRVSSKELAHGCVSDIVSSTFDAGYIKRPLGPGLGVVVNEDAIREAAAIGHRWRNPVWRNADGCVTEW